VKVRDWILNRNSAKRELNTIKRDIVVFTFFLFLSFGFWYINSLGKEVESEIKYPVKYINLPKERTIDETSLKLNLYIKGPGYSVLKLRVSGNRAPVQVDLTKVNYKRVPESKNADYFILTSALLKSFTVQIRSGCEVVAIRPDTLFFTFNKTGAR
jgi:hypothetical protein